jgi:DNA-binding NarL/FixJ family response regulator
LWDAARDASLGDTAPGGTVYPDALTTREVDVLRLVAQGLSDRAVAEALVISTRTVQGHLRSIYSKINLHSRAAATRYAVAQGLA